MDISIRTIILAILFLVIFAVGVFIIYEVFVGTFANENDCIQKGGICQMSYCSEGFKSLPYSCGEGDVVEWYCCYKLT